jgi:Family of unknown function (DUF5670)
LPSSGVGWKVAFSARFLPIFAAGATILLSTGSYWMELSRQARQDNLFKERNPMFLILAVVLVLLWLGGFFVLHVSSFLIHLLLIFALISIIMNFVGGRRAV